MSKGNSTFRVWRCSECNAPHSTTTYNRRNENVAKELKKHCKHCRKHVVFKGKDSKKGGTKALASKK